MVGGASPLTRGLDVPIHSRGHGRFGKKGPKIRIKIKRMLRKIRRQRRPKKNEFATAFRVLLVVGNERSSSAERYPSCLDRGRCGMEAMTECVVELVADIKVQTPSFPSCPRANDGSPKPSRRRLAATRKLVVFLCT